jgi:hypothetical protein
MTAKITDNTAQEDRFPNLETVVAPRHDNAVNRYLNPTWVEALMGWPRGWTKIRPFNKNEWAAWQRNAMALWQDGVSWEQGLKRTTTRKRHRVQRLQAIGNGQVPQCVVLAYVILSAHAQDKSEPKGLWDAVR